MANILTFFIALAILMISVVLHELGHGYSADYFGDPTPRQQGRLTLNPIKHLDFYGSLIFPLFMFALGGIIFAWAKPIIVNPANFRDEWKKYGFAICAACGPAVNFSLALIIGFLANAADPHGILWSIAYLAVFINVLLGLFNLLPFPPLDGSKIIAPLLPANVRQKIEHAGLSWILIALVVAILLLPYIIMVTRAITNFIIPMPPPVSQSFIRPF